ncbi:helix-turn-helix transcriptional regulator [Streptomyces sp. ISL-100]|uniref:ArsR/SmtB family transcription factor n=1 Tax=Streptomyces sp. ISL-100 TaxID=2819173 RepID=UPI001BEC4D80|nr:helix-turn-helix domain-containing protein [Streptomyces sp. ISL-100]MBT2400997.1 helix-turn-helix transcriptional regulator [Streptomyces sp. ISL-100]
MLRVHFSGVDLSRVRLSDRPDALWETVLSFHRLRDRRGAKVFGEWRRESRTRLNGETRLLAPVIPSRGYFPDFLTPREGVRGMEAGLEAVRATATERLRAELALLAASHRQSDRTAPQGCGASTQQRRHAAPLAGGRGDALALLAGALRGYHRAAVEPYWPHIQSRIEADRAARGRALLDGGADELLASLPPMLRWRPPVLEADYPVDRDLYLRGRGLLLQPSFFCRGTPVVYRDPQLPPVLVYPVTHADAPAPADDPGPPLGRLVGQTRSTVLAAIGGGCTTSELARRAGVSLASASQHACVLREAGLVVTLRHGNSVLHTLTPLGAALLRGGATAESLQ